MTEQEQFLARTGLTNRQLTYWVQQGWIKPEGRGGTGYAWRWPADEVRVAALMARLVGAGFAPALAHRIARGEREIAPGILIEIGEAA